MSANVKQFRSLFDLLLTRFSILSHHFARSAWEKLTTVDKEDMGSVRTSQVCAHLLKKSSLLQNVTEFNIPVAPRCLKHNRVPLQLLEALAPHLRVIRFGTSNSVPQAYWQVSFGALIARINRNIIEELSIFADSADVVDVLLRRSFPVLRKLTLTRGIPTTGCCAKLLDCFVSTKFERLEELTVSAAWPQRSDFSQLCRGLMAAVPSLKRLNFDHNGESSIDIDVTKMLVGARDVWRENPADLAERLGAPLNKLRISGYTISHLAGAKACFEECVGPAASIPELAFQLASFCRLKSAGGNVTWLKEQVQLLVARVKSSPNPSMDPIIDLLVDYAGLLLVTKDSGAKQAVRTVKWAWINSALSAWQYLAEKLEKFAIPDFLQEKQHTSAILCEFLSDQVWCERVRVFSGFNRFECNPQDMTTLWVGILLDPLLAPAFLAHPQFSICQINPRTEVPLVSTLVSLAFARGACEAAIQALTQAAQQLGTSEVKKIFVRRTRGRSSLMRNNSVFAEFCSAISCLIRNVQDVRGPLEEGSLS